MSQRRFVCRDLSVLTGWDRPLSMFFLVVDRVPGTPWGDAGNEPIYSNLDDPDYPFRTVDVVVDRLRTLEITLPPTFVADLLADQRANAGNLQRTYPPVAIAS
jgi:hypothetical protein